MAGSSFSMTLFHNFLVQLGDNRQCTLDFGLEKPDNAFGDQQPGGELHVGCFAADVPLGEKHSGHDYQWMYPYWNGQLC